MGSSAFTTTLPLPSALRRDGHLLFLQWGPLHPPVPRHPLARPALRGEKLRAVPLWLLVRSRHPPTPGREEGKGRKGNAAGRGVGGGWGLPSAWRKGSRGGQPVQIPSLMAPSVMSSQGEEPCLRQGPVILTTWSPELAGDPMPTSPDLSHIQGGWWMQETWAPVRLCFHLSCDLASPHLGSGQAVRPSALSRLTVSGSCCWWSLLAPDEDHASAHDSTAPIPSLSAPRASPKWSDWSGDPAQTAQGKASQGPMWG